MSADPATGEAEGETDGRPLAGADEEGEAEGETDGRPLAKPLAGAAGFAEDGGSVLPRLVHLDGIARASASCASLKWRSFLAASLAPKCGPPNVPMVCATRPSEWMLRTTARMSLASKRSTVMKRS